MKQTQAISAFSALSNNMRLDILRALVKAGANGLLAGDIARVITATPSKTSFHLSALTDAGLIYSTREAREITYFVDFRLIGSLMKFLLEDCCGSNEVARQCCFSKEDCC